MRRHFFTPSVIPRPTLHVGDVLILLGVVALLYLGVRLAFGVPAAVRGPVIDLAPQNLPWYAALSFGRMYTAYLLALAFTLPVGYLAARYRTVEAIVLPLLDVLQSVPILSFLPVVVLGLTALLPERVAVEFASIILIFTSQVWNLTFSFYQSMKTVPHDLGEAAQVFRLNGWLRFRTAELPFATVPLLWNSLMSWAGGWFFLMAGRDLYGRRARFSARRAGSLFAVSGECRRRDRDPVGTRRPDRGHCPARSADVASAPRVGREIQSGNGAGGRAARIVGARAVDAVAAGARL